MDAGDVSVAVLAAVLAVYLFMVSRKRQRYSSEAVFHAPIEAVWRLHDIRPGRAGWVPQLVSCEWVDEAAQDMRATYRTGAELRMRVIESEPPHSLVTEARVRSRADAPFGDVLKSYTVLTPREPGEVHVAYVIEIERQAGLANFGMRLGYPWLLTYTARLMRVALQKDGHDQPRPRRAMGGVGVQMALVAATILWLGWLVGPWAGLGLLVMLLVHEYGHVWSMRRHGHETARMYLVPFFGGVAIGSRAFETEAEAVEIFLMGPIFGLLPSLASLAVFGMTGDAFFASLAGFLALCNGFNLAPFPPLDGGRVAQSLLRPFGDQAWYVFSGLLVLAGAFVAAYFKLAGLLLVAAIGVWAWASTGSLVMGRRPLSGGGWTASLVVYLMLIAAHVAVVVWAFSVDGAGPLDLGPAFVQERALAPEDQ